MELAPFGHDGVRQAGALEHLSAVGTHLQLFFAALFGATGARQEESRSSPNSVLVPTGALKERWDLLMMVMILYSAASVPVRVCFNSHAEGLLWDLEAGFSVLFLIDVGLAFNTAYQQDGLWAPRRRTRRAQPRGIAREGSVHRESPPN